MSMRILVTDFAWQDLEIERRILAPLNAEILAAQTGDEDELSKLATNVRGIFTNWKRVPRRVIEKSPSCQVIVRYGVGLDNIDVEFATEAGIMVANVPYYCIEEVSDHTLALLLALTRKIALFDRATKAGTYNLSAGTPMYRHRGRTLGLLGFGGIGQMVCRKAQGLGFNVIVHTRSNNSASEVGARSVTFDDLISKSDYISIHVPLTPATRHLFRFEVFQRMKPTALLINTSRGDIVDRDGLLKALDEGIISGAGLDVLSKEPPDSADRLLAHPNIIVTPHAAFNSEESLFDLRVTAATAMLRALSGTVPNHLVNPDVLRSPRLRFDLASSL
jgi:D-3-phosphoglycerate dehydrogenase